jgi:FkbM family methyltransferase
MLLSYAHWLAMNSAGRRGPIKRLRGRMLVSGFTRFSEFLAVDDFVSDAEFAFFSSLDFQNGDIVDVGANMGVTSILFAQLAPQARVFAIEPNRHTHLTLLGNIELNDVRNIHAHQLAISDRTGTIAFSSHPVSRGTASIATEVGPYTETLSTNTLDDFVAARGIKRISLLKIDVEGFETLVLRGAKHCLRGIRPRVIYFEVYPSGARNAGFNPEEPAQILSDAGYRLQRLSRSGGLVDASPSDIGGIVYENWIATDRPGASR